MPLRFSDPAERLAGVLLIRGTATKRLREVMVVLVA
jgi:hypothetical protein